jgi:hypothetical protein
MIPIPKNLEFWRKSIRANIKFLAWNETETKDWMVRLVTIRPDLTEVLLEVLKVDYPHHLPYIHKVLLLL